MPDGSDQSGSNEGRAEGGASKQSEKGIASWRHLMEKHLFFVVTSWQVTRPAPWVGGEVGAFLHSLGLLSASLLPSWEGKAWTPFYR